jgi:hypothetical protein
MEAATEPLYATVHKRANPPELAHQRPVVHIPQVAQDINTGQEQGFRPYRSFRQSGSSQPHYNSCQQQQQCLNNHHVNSSNLQQIHRHNNNHHPAWHVRQKTEIWSDGYKVVYI